MDDIVLTPHRSTPRQIGNTVGGMARMIETLADYSDHDIRAWTVLASDNPADHAMGWGNAVTVLTVDGRVTGRWNVLK